MKKNQPALGITPVDELCVKVAALCHDLGHGPFSHLFETALENLGLDGWKHEMASILLFDRMIDTNENLRCAFEAFGLFENERKLIKDLIYNEQLKESKNLKDYEDNV